MPAGVLRDRALADLGRADWSPDLARAIDARVATWLQLSDAEQEVIHAIVPTGR